MPSEILEDFAVHFLDFGSIAAGHVGERFGICCHAHLGEEILEGGDAGSHAVQFFVVDDHVHRNDPISGSSHGRLSFNEITELSAGGSEKFFIFGVPQAFGV